MVEYVLRGALGTYFPWILYALALIATFYFKVPYLQSIVFFMGGVQGIWAAIAHLFFPVAAAKQIGWQSNGFQTEMGFTNLALGVTGLLSWFYPDWAVPVGLTVAIVFAGCAYIHIKDLVVNKNKAPCNSGPMLYITIVVALSLFAALFLHVDSEEAIRAALNRWPKDFNEKNIPAVCGLFAPDLVASYPGTPDRNHEQMCQTLSASLSDPDKTYRYQLPQIEQVILGNDLGAVRLIWTLDVLDRNQNVLEHVEERGLDVFRRQEDGNWKIAISYAYPISA